MKPLAIACLAGIGLLAAALPASAQTELERFERQLEQIQRQTRMRIDPAVPAGQRVYADFGGYLSLNYLSLDDQYGRNHGLRQYDLVGYGRLNFDGVHEFFGSVRASWRDFGPGDSFDGQGDDYIGDVDRAYYRFDLARYFAAYQGEKLDYNITLTAGRQLAYWANGLTLSQVVDAAVIDVETGPLTVQLLAGVTPTRTVDFDSSRPHFDDHTRRAFYGGLVSFNLGEHRPFAYALFQQDLNHDDVSELGVIKTRFNYFSWYLGAGSTGNIGDRIVYGLEAVYEGGSGLSNSFDPDTFFPVDQKKEDLQAWAADLRIDYLLNDTGHTRFSFETILASGDQDRLHGSNTFGGNRPGTSDHSFNAFGLLNTGLAFSPMVSNVMIFRVGASTFPFAQTSWAKRMQVGADFFVFNKLQRDGALDEQTDVGRYLGVEPDIYINWQISSDVTLVLRYGVFFPNGDVIQNGEARQFFFAGLTLAF